MRIKIYTHVIIAAVLLVAGTTASAENWPMWRYDAGRTAASPEELPAELHLQWIHQYSERETTWDDPLNQDLMRFDEVFEPVVWESLLFIGFNDADKVVALDTETGEEVWTHYVDGPVRMPVAVADGKLYCVSDDGYLYCLDATKGRLLWKFSGAPKARHILGNKRLISTWPARGGVVVGDGVVYFAAGIWPFMGTFLYALDAESGEVIWLNDSNGLQWMIQPHRAPSFGGVAPQGVMVIAENHLLVPGGRSVPAGFDRKTGEFVHYLHNENNKTGGAFVATIEGIFFNHHREALTAAYDVETGLRITGPVGQYPALTPDMVYYSGDTIQAVPMAAVKANKIEAAWNVEVDASNDLIKSGSRLYAAGDGQITAVSISGDTPEIAWQKRVPGDVARLIAANGRLFAVTKEGAILAFGEKKQKPRNHQPWADVADTSQATLDTVKEIINTTGVDSGYAVYYGPGNGDVLEALLATTDLHIIAVDEDAGNVQALRERFDGAGLYGKRVAVRQGTPASFNTPQYMASLTILGDATADETVFAEQLYPTMRPYGGTLWAMNAPLPLTGSYEGIQSYDGGKRLVREGALKGAAPWTHQLGDIAQTGKSDDQLVKLPLGLLWFGGSSNLDVLPRHGHGPPEQVIGGRLFIQGMDRISARDVYTGQVLWKKILPELNNFGVYFDHTHDNTPTSTRYNQVHIAGANIRGTNYVATEDKLYAIHDEYIDVMDTATGDSIGRFDPPPYDPDAKRKSYPAWAYLGTYGDYLIGGLDFVAFSDIADQKKSEYNRSTDFDKSASKGLQVMNRHTGEKLWKTMSHSGYLHNGIAVANDTIYVLDKLPVYLEKQLERRGKIRAEVPTLTAFDIASGDVKWSTQKDVFGSFLACSKEHDILLQSTRPSRDTVQGEDGRRIIAYRASTGEVIWDEELRYQTFPLIHGEKIVTESGLFSLLTGEPLMREDAITGEELPWRFTRNYGCNHPVASEHLVTFRSGAAGFADLFNSSGTGNFGGFKSSCTSNLVVAEGVLNAPDYTRTCSCAYQNQTSLAMVHMPDVETWLFHDYKLPENAVQRLGLNFGAPGDRMDDAGTLWLDFPSNGGPSPEVAISTVPETPDVFRHHSARMEDSPMPWVGASGLKGAESIQIQLADGPIGERRYTVRLYFSENESLAAGERVMDVALQGNSVLSGLDVVSEAGAAMTTVVKEFNGIAADETLTVSLKSANASATVISGIEVIAE